MTEMGWIVLLLIIPVVTGLISWRIKNRTACETFQATGAFLMLLVGLSLSYKVITGSTISGINGVFYVDSLGAFSLLLIVLVGFTSSLHSIGYMRHEFSEKRITEQQFRRYYLWSHLFLATLLGVSVVNNLGLMWGGIELATLVSTLLVALYQKGTALEAAWKFLMMGSVGIAFALLGIIFLYVSGMNLFDGDSQALNWTTLIQVAKQLNPQWIFLGYIFIIVGLGTKAGLAPMHFWLPDAHSQAPSPISAVLSGVLLNTALYAIFRVYIIVHPVLHEKAAELLIFFGLLSIMIAVPFMVVQHDLKRMLAYSSVEHVGIITFGVGIGGTVGIYGALLHMFNHSITKSLLFFAVGNITQKYHSKRIDRVVGVMKVLPVTGPIFLIGMFAITGMPPLNVFISEFTIMTAGFQRGHIGSTVCLIVLIVFIFSGMLFYTIKMSFGEPRMKLKKGEINGWSTAALFLPLMVVVLFGFYVPPFFSDMIHQIGLIFEGVHR